MNIIETFPRKSEASFPSEMEEISSADYLYFMKLLLQADENKWTLHDIKVRMIFRFLGIKPKLDKFHPEREREVRYNNVSMLADMLYFMFDFQQDNYSPAKSLKNFVPKYKGLIGPADSFSNLVVIEYIHAAQAMMDFARTNDESKLDELIAILYRPRKKFVWLRRKLQNFDGQERIKFNQNTYQSRVKKVSKWPAEVKQAIYLYFIACDEFIKGEVEINGNHIDFSLLYKQSDDDSSGEINDNLGLLGILYKVAEAGTFGSIETTSFQNLYDFMLKLYQNRVEHENHKIKSKRYANNSQSKAD